MLKFLKDENTKGSEDTLFLGVDTNKTRRAENWLDAQVRIAAKEGPFGVQADLTPELAELLLSRNPGNRPLSRVTLARLCQDIRAGLLKPNGETIIVSKEGLLNDGQHRCAAVKATGRIVKVAFWFGAERDSRLTVDCGAARTVGQYLSMDGVKDGNNVATVYKNLIQIERYGEISASPDKIPTKQEVLEFASRHPDVEQIVGAVPSHGAGRIGGKSVLATALFLCARVDDARAHEFMHRFCTGEGLTARDPILVAREYLSEQYLRAKSARRPGLTAQHKLEIILRAWTNWMHGKKQTRVQTSGKLPRLTRW